MREPRRVFVVGIGLLALGLGLGACSRKPIGGGEVVVYTSVDQVYSQPILAEFKAKTGIEVRAVYDVEASKTTGLVNRLLAERDRPQCDVFWNGEVARTLVLKEKGALAPYASPEAAAIPARLKDSDGAWTGFAARARALVYNTRLVAAADLPRSLFDLADPRWKGKVAIAYPLFGTTATHVAALFAALGEARATALLTALKRNEVSVVDGNSTVRDLVADGRYPLGLTDTDDVEAGMREGRPIGMAFLDQAGMGTLLIPNTVALVRGAPHGEAGRRLIDHLLSADVERRLLEAGAAQVPVRTIGGAAAAKPAAAATPMHVSFEEIAQHLDRSTRFSQELFVR